MPAMRDLIVHVDDADLSSHAMDLGAVLAAELGAALTALVVTPPLNAGFGLNAATAALAQQLERAQREEMLAVGERLVAQARERHAVPIGLRLVDGDPVETLQAASRTADLLITSQRDPQRQGGLSTAQSARLLVGAACPVLKVPCIGWGGDGATPSREHALRRALVAWADTRESARALRDALPLLVRAREVELVTFTDADPADLLARDAQLHNVVDHLEHHGIQAELTVLNQATPSLGERMRRGWVPDVAIAEALLSHAAHVHADFIVMGGYGHSRLRELVLGGVTRTMLESMTVPVLMSH